MPVHERLRSLRLRDPERREVPAWVRSSRAVAHRSVRRLVGQADDGGIPVPPPPPACPPGWRTAPPDFVGVGGQRCGTTRWFDLIAAHPQVAPPLVTKELHYFDRFYAGGFGASDAAGYHAYFPREGALRTGEWTPGYMSAPWIPKLLAAAAPDARLLVLLRDPVERYLSGLQHDAILSRDLYGAPLSQLAPFDALMRGFYHAQLQGLLRHFERSRVLVLQYERCSAEPVAQLERTYEFLELESGFVPDVGAHPHRQPDKPSLKPEVRDAYVESFREDVTRLAESFPEIDIGLWPNFAHLAG